MQFLNNFSLIVSKIKKLYFFIFIINLCLIIDVAICTSPEFIHEEIISPFGILTFIMITLGTIFGQLYLQKFVEKDNEELYQNQNIFCLLQK